MSVQKSTTVARLLTAAFIQVRRISERVDLYQHAYCLDCDRQVVIRGRTCACGSESWRPIARTPLARRAA